MTGALEHGHLLSRGDDPLEVGLDGARRCEQVVASLDDVVGHIEPQRLGRQAFLHLRGQEDAPREHHAAAQGFHLAVGHSGRRANQIRQAGQPRRIGGAEEPPQRPGEGEVLLLVHRVGASDRLELRQHRGVAGLPCAGHEEVELSADRLRPAGDLAGADVRGEKVGPPAHHLGRDGSSPGVSEQDDVVPAEAGA